MYGGIEDSGQSKIAPTGDIYTLKINPRDSTWEKQQSSGDETPLPRTQHIALATAKKDRIFVFGGHASPTRRLNDCWWLKVQDMSWSRVKGDVDVDENQESAIGAPPPRANMGACCVEDKVYIYGGHGGLSYARKAFQDIFCFDMASQTWEEFIPVQ